MQVDLAQHGAARRGFRCFLERGGNDAHATTALEHAGRPLETGALPAFPQRGSRASGSAHLARARRKCSCSAAAASGAPWRESAMHPPPASGQSSGSSSLRRVQACLYYLLRCSAALAAAPVSCRCSAQATRRCALSCLQAFRATNLGLERRLTPSNVDAKEPRLLISCESLRARCISASPTHRPSSPAHCTSSPPTAPSSSVPQTTCGGSGWMACSTWLTS